MLEIRKKYLTYKSAELGTPVSHYILIQVEPKKSTLLSHVNLFLYRHTRQSEKTSSRYASVISMFYRFLSLQDEFKNLLPGSYHIHTRNKHIKRWQSHRNITRTKNNDTRPTTETIFEEAKLLLNFFRWLGDNNFTTGVEIKLKTWIPPFKSARYQDYISLRARNSINSSSINVLDKISRQSQIKGLITPSEIQQLGSSYHDPVYATLLIFAIGTAMRPMDLCRFPYYGNGANEHIMPASAMQFTLPTVNYLITNSKGRKIRSIIIHRDALEQLEDTYIKPYYSDRAKKYAQNYGKKPPLGLLFITADGHPVTPNSIAQRTTAAKKKAKLSYPNLRDNLRFYDARDWWPTQFLIRSFGDKLLQSNEGLFNTAVAQVLLAQMGHKSLITTFNHYIDLARVILSIYQGKDTEIFKAANLNATHFLNAIQPVVEADAL